MTNISASSSPGSGPKAAGGKADKRSRQVAQLMQGILGQTITIDNQADGGGRGRLRPLATTSRSR